jgi:phosphatidylserine/phosphatidylglycerophosphate/cardiolipin synthase-like enzyme
MEKFGEYRKWHLVSKYGIPIMRNIINPRDIPDPQKSKEALGWLSRGLEEALLDFLSQASGSKFQLRAAVYEFTHKETLQALADAVERGVDVKVIRHCKGVHHPKVKRNNIIRDEHGKVVTEWIPDTTTAEATKAIENIGKPNSLERQRLTDIDMETKISFYLGFQSLEHAHTWHRDTFIERRHSSALMHNKFIILVENGIPKQVWTGSTNFTDGGIYGQR